MAAPSISAGYLACGIAGAICLLVAALTWPGAEVQRLPAETDRVAASETAPASGLQRDAFEPRARLLAPFQGLALGVVTVLGTVLLTVGIVAWLVQTGLLVPATPADGWGQADDPGLAWQDARSAGPSHATASPGSASAVHPYYGAGARQATPATASSAGRSTRPSARETAPGVGSRSRTNRSGVSPARNTAPSVAGAGSGGTRGASRTGQRGNRRPGSRASGTPARPDEHAGGGVRPPYGPPRDPVSPGKADPAAPVRTAELPPPTAAPPPERTSAPQPTTLIDAWNEYRRNGDGHFNAHGLQRVLAGRGIGSPVHGGGALGAAGRVLLVEFAEDRYYVLPSFAKSPRAVKEWFHDNSGGALTGRTEQVIKVAEVRRTGEVLQRGEVA